MYYYHSTRTRFLSPVLHPSSIECPSSPPSAPPLPHPGGPRTRSPLVVGREKECGQLGEKECGLRSENRDMHSYNTCSCFYPSSCLCLVFFALTVSSPCCESGTRSRKNVRRSVLFIVCIGGTEGQKDRRTVLGVKKKNEYRSKGV